LCLGVPAEVKEIKEDVMIVDFGNGVLREVYGGTISDVKPGDVVIVHAGIVIEVVKDEKAKKFVELLRDMACCYKSAELGKAYEDLAKIVMEFEKEVDNLEPSR